MIKDGQAVIINLDDQYGPGTHWTALVNQSNINMYFDSFGMPPPSEFERNVDYYSTIDYQPESSSKCGYYAMKVVKDCLSGQDFVDVLKQFDVNQKINDIKINTL